MRITGGVQGGARLDVPGGRVRPTQDKVRQALFSALGDRVPGCRFLDLFAGSGAVGLDAWSRGAGVVCWVEADRRVCSVLRRNVDRLCTSGPRAGGDAKIGGAGMASTEGEVRVVRADAIRFLESGAGGMKFDLVFSDPPYEREGAGGWLGRIACALEKGAVLASEGIWIMEQPRRQDVPTPPAWREIWRRVYGDTELRMLVPDSETR